MKNMKKQMNVVEKILAAHLVEGDASKDTELGIRIDQTLTQDATGTMAYLQFESMGVNHVKNAVTNARSEIKYLGSLMLSRIIYSRNVSLCKVNDVDIVADTRSVVCIVIVSVN